MIVDFRLYMVGRFAKFGTMSLSSDTQTILHLNIRRPHNDAHNKYAFQPDTCFTHTWPMQESVAVITHDYRCSGLQAEPGARKVHGHHAGRQAEAARAGQQLGAAAGSRPA